MVLCPDLVRSHLDRLQSHQDTLATRRRNVPCRFLQGSGLPSRSHRESHLVPSRRAVVQALHRDAYSSVYRRTASYD